MFWRNTRGTRALAAEFDEVRSLERALPEEDAVVGDDADGEAGDAGEAADERRAVARLELVEARAIDEAGDDFAHVVGTAVVGRDDAVELLGMVERGFSGGDFPGRGLGGGDAGDDAAHDAQGVLVVLGEVVGDTADAGVDIGAAKLFGSGLFARGRFHEGRAAEEDGARSPHDDGLVAHGGDIGAASGAGAHDGGDLVDALRAEASLVVEDAAEVVAVGEDVVLEGQEGATGIDEIDAGEVVLLGDLLGAEVLAHGQGVVGAALDGGVVRDGDALAPAHTPDAGDDAGGGHLVIVDAVGGEGA